MLVDGDIADREVVDHPGGVGIIGLTEDNEILLVRQFRYPFIKKPFMKFLPVSSKKAKTLKKRVSGNFQRNAEPKRRFLNPSAKFIRHRVTAVKSSGFFMPKVLLTESSILMMMNF